MWARPFLPPSLLGPLQWMMSSPCLSSPMRFISNIHWLVAQGKLWSLRLAISVSGWNLSLLSTPQSLLKDSCSNEVFKYKTHVDIDFLYERQFLFYVMVSEHLYAGKPGWERLYELFMMTAEKCGWREVIMSKQIGPHLWVHSHPTLVLLPLSHTLLQTG